MWCILLNHIEAAMNLFQYLKGVYTQRFKVKTNVKQEEWFQFLKEIPQKNEYIKCPYLEKEGIIKDIDEEDSIILQVRKPEISSCPEISDSLKEFVIGDWKDPTIELKWKKFVLREENGIQKKIELIGDNERKKEWIYWNKERENWKVERKSIDEIDNLFTKLRKYYEELRRDSERLELIIGEGILEDKTDHTVFYPVLLKKVFIEFQAEENTIIIKDSEKDSELNITFLQSIKNRNINPEAIKMAQKELEENLYHPLEENTHLFLKGFTHSLDSSSRYLENEKEKANEKDEIIVYCNPVLFVREKISGVLRSLDLTIKEIEESQNIEGPLTNFLTGEGDKPKQEEKIDLKEELSLARGEDKDILLSKDANKEQLEIAKNIEKYNAVVVQGPLGTGKTHTIANLMGHFLAQGKNILVTSQTKKALSVVKEKVVPELQSLCVSLLKDNNTDMEQSIDSITEYISYHTPEEVLQEVKKYEGQRQRILKELEDTRNRIYSIQRKEYESIVIAGKGYSVIEAAKFVKEYEQTLSYLPGTVALYKPLPLSVEELKFLYETNGSISQEEEVELQYQLPAPDTILSPEEFTEILRKRKEVLENMVQLQEKIDKHKVLIDLENHTATIEQTPLYVNLNKEKLMKLKTLCNTIERKDFLQWQIDVMLAGKEENGYKVVWKKFVEKIKETNEVSNDVMPKIVGKTIKIAPEDISERNMQIVEEMKEFIAKGKKVNGFLTFALHKDWKELYSKGTINQQFLSTVEDCEILLSHMKLTFLRNEIKEFWDTLIENKGGITSMSLS